MHGCLLNAVVKVTIFWPGNIYIYIYYRFIVRFPIGLDLLHSNMPIHHTELGIVDMRSICFSHVIVGKVHACSYA